MHGVHQIQGGHDLVHRDLAGDAGDQGGDHEEVADQLVAGELEAVEDVGQHGADEHAAHQDADHNEKAVEEGAAHISLLPCGLEVLKVGPGPGEDHDIGVLVLLRALERGDDAGDDGHQRHKGGENQKYILDHIDESPLELHHANALFHYFLPPFPSATQ